MFRAIADQLLINGCLGHSIESLRHTAIRYLRQNPFHQDKGHLSSFLTEESWEEYLTRMSRSGEWSDHIILHAVADMFSLEVIVFNVFRDDICRTEVKGNMCKNNQNRLTIFLGHLGEFHYLSLRPKLWLRHWPYKVLILRILACSKDIDSDTKRHFIAQQVKRMIDERFITETTLQEVAKFAMHKIAEGEDEGMGVKCTNNPEWTRVFRQYIQTDLQSEETEGSFQHLTEDGMQIDSLTGIPIIHLSFIMKILLSHTLKKIYLTPQGHLCYIGERREILCYHFIGPYCDPCYFTLKDITRSKKMSKFYNKRHLKKPRIVIIRKDKSLIFELPPEKENSPSRLYVDTSGSRPGYCRIKLQIYCRDDNILQIGSNVYLKENEVPERIKTVTHFHEYEVQYIGFQCPFPPMTSQWREKKRNYDFPSAVLIDRARGRKVTLIPKAHPRSENPTIEWKFDFSLAEFTMITNLTKAQQYGYFVIKVLLENMTSHLNKTLKRKHLKAVFLNAAEEMPSSAWDTCFSGCILHVISKLLTCLKTGFLSHYFIPSNNLIDCFSEADINALSLCVESIRLFPVNIIQFVAEMHGFMYGKNLIDMILSDVPSFMQTKNLRSTVEKTLIPTAIRTTKVLSRMGFYDAVSQLLENMYEQLLLLPDSERNTPNFQDFIQDVIDKIDQRSSRIILAKDFDRDYGLNLSANYTQDNAFQLKNLLPWEVDDTIGWLNVPEARSSDLTSIAYFLYKYSLRELEKRNVTLSFSAIEVAIRCLKHVIKQNSLDMSTIEDQILKEDVFSQTRELKQHLNQCYVHLYHATCFEMYKYPLIDHMDDIERQCEEFPGMLFVVSEMFRVLRMPDKQREYELKFRSYLSETGGPKLIFLY